jgi:hypothetical protein
LQALCVSERRGALPCILRVKMGAAGFEPATISRVKRGQDAVDLADLQGKAGQFTGCSTETTR